MISLFQYPVLTVLLYGNKNRTVDGPPNEVMLTAVRVVDDRWVDAR